MRKSQASVEFLVVLAVVLVIMVVMGFFVYQKFIRGDELKILINGIRVVNTVASSINEINAVGDGYSQNFDIPRSLYGSRDYKIRLFDNESAVYIEGGSFLRGITLVWSAPLGTQRVNCVMAECNTGCNRTTKDECLQVNDSMSIRAVNHNGIVYLANTYNIRQGGSAFYISPIRGNETYRNSDCRGGNFIYIYENTFDGSENLVFKHNSSVSGGSLRMTFSEGIGSLSLNLSDNPGEMNLNQGLWTLVKDECKGGVIQFKEGVHFCATVVTDNGGMNCAWLNGDDSIINLDKTKKLCISYP